jgi:hypothetical protein
MDFPLSPAQLSRVDFKVHTHNGLNHLAKKRKLDENLSVSGLGSHDQTEFAPPCFPSDLARRDDIYDLLKKESEVMIQLTVCGYSLQEACRLT